MNVQGPTLAWQSVLLVRLAFRNILRHRRRTLLTMLSMTGGYILCAAAISLQYGSYGNAIEFFVKDRTGHIQIHEGNYLQRPRIHKAIAEPDDLARRLINDADVIALTTRVFAPSLAYSEHKNAPANVIGVDVDGEAATTTIIAKVHEGEFLTGQADADGYFSALIGMGLADLLKIGVGDELILISVGADGSIANDIFIVRGLVGTRRSADRLNVYLPLGAAQAFLSMGDRVHEFSLIIRNLGDSVAVADRLSGLLPESLSVDPWERVELTFYKTMQADREAMFVTLGIVVFIVCIGVLNTVLMSVLERTREFGVLKAIGTRPGRIAWMVLTENAILSGLSCLLGLFLALPIVGFMTIVGFELAEPMDVGGVLMSHVRGEFSLRIFAVPFALVVTTAVLVSIPPGIRAARILPIQALAST